MWRRIKLHTAIITRRLHFQNYHTNTRSVEKWKFVSKVLGVGTLFGLYLMNNTGRLSCGTQDIPCDEIELCHYPPNLYCSGITDAKTIEYLKTHIDERLSYLFSNFSSDLLENLEMFSAEDIKRSKFVDTHWDYKIACYTRLLKRMLSEKEFKAYWEKLITKCKKKHN